MTNESMPLGEITSDPLKNLFRPFSRVELSVISPLVPNKPADPFIAQKLEQAGIRSGEHTILNKQIPFYILDFADPRGLYDEPYVRAISPANYLIAQCKAAALKNETIQEAVDMLEHRRNYAYRGFRVSLHPNIADQHKSSTSSASLTTSLLMYGLDYPPFNSKRGEIYMAKHDPYRAVVASLPIDERNEILPGQYKVLYSGISIYNSNGIEDIDKNYPMGIRVTDNQTLRDKLQGVIILPWKASLDTNNTVV